MSILDYFSNRENWLPGEVAWFEYHCNESLDSTDARAWLRSHQRVTIVGRDPSRDDAWEGSSIDERIEEGCQKVYRVRFVDGLEWDAFEDELMSDCADFERPDPPKVDDSMCKYQSCR